VGNGREYRVRWADNSESTVTSNTIFGAFTPHHRLDTRDHVLAWHCDHFMPATVVCQLQQSDKLKIKFTDGSTTYVTLR